MRVDVDVISRGAAVRRHRRSGATACDFEQIAFSSPVRARPSLPYGRDALILDVPARSQYVMPEERGWCSPASLSMIHAYHGIDVSVEETARAVFDRAYNGTGNWAFNVAFSGRLGLRGVVAHLQNLDHAQRLIERNLPLAISYSWRDGELPGAPLEHSDGHLAVLLRLHRRRRLRDQRSRRAQRARRLSARCDRSASGSAMTALPTSSAPVGIEFADVLSDR